MLGWDFFIYKETSKDTLVKGRLAYDGLWWIKPLLENGEVQDLGSNGYPDLYKVKVKDLLGFLVLYPDLDISKIEDLGSEEFLFLEAWDLS